jgi:hypothetical protein
MASTSTASLQPNYGSGAALIEEAGVASGSATLPVLFGEKYKAYHMAALCRMAHLSRSL